ncbi:MAG: hypothetical protein CMH38_03405 [Microbacterium sp.]|uniref:hypothetical protein n=1 Tax=Microbacterium sp. TaxID=51671 RepID=UPI000C4C6619|nr:hypothetical protein [Microbacterium sp.]MAY48965.1 hypothetical protein [Microbacterium sp.]MBS69357.1 hypothetical protein [Pseudomonas sp.]|tara:strand:- start:5722 stop:5994 length:273 start_codon:yes stop_codon:yes gene_type:complete
MSGTRPLLVDQDENEHGEFWVRLRGGNGMKTFTSEMHPTRSNAVRAARAYIAAIEPVPVIFTYWTGKLPDRDQTRKVRAAEKVTERFHGA